MSQNNIAFKRTVKNNGAKIQQREIIKRKLMTKYNISLEEAEEILKKFEKKKNIQKTGNIEDNKKNNAPEKNLRKQNSENIHKIENDHIQPSDNLTYEKLNYNKNNLNEKTSQNDKIPIQYESNNQDTDVKDNSKTSNEQKIGKQDKEIKPTTKQNVDSILTEFIPDYNKNPNIELDNVNLTFEIVPDKIDTLKEYFIRTLKKNKSENIKLNVLKDISFKIYPGEKVGIIGYNGAGKSTLLKLICGIYPPDSGTVKTKGNISPLLSLGAGFDFNYSGRKNIYLNGAVLGYEKHILQEKEKEIIEFSELEEFIDMPIKNYSSGMLAKLGFSIATIVNPDILIIDEILGVGDINFQKKSADKIRSLMDGGTTVLLVSHSISQIRQLCDKAIWIDKGHLREIGEVNTVCDKYIKDSEKASYDQLKNIELK